MFVHLLQFANMPNVCLFEYLTMLEARTAMTSWRSRIQLKVFKDFDSMYDVHELLIYKSGQYHQENTEKD